jgi:hypothetical protein
MPCLALQLLAAYGLQGLQVWNTEGGLNFKDAGMSTRDAAGFVARSLIVDWGLQLQTSCWYAYDGGLPVSESF